MVLEKGGKDLATILKNYSLKSAHIPLSTIFYYWMEMIYAVQQIHSHGIIHSDLKPANFLQSDNGGLKLIDFGIASCVDNEHTSVLKTCQEGSCNYISPEALNQEGNSNSTSSTNTFKVRNRISLINEERFNRFSFQISFKSDVWSLGCILYQMVYKRTPFQHVNPLYAKLMAISSPTTCIEYPRIDWISPRIINTIKKCLQYEARLRPSVAELINEYEMALKHM